MLMPAIHISALFIGQEDWEDDNSSGVATEYDDNTDVEAWGVRTRFLGGHPPPTLGRAFWEEVNDNKD